jgi:benzoate-CoA ligase family protein
MIAEASETVPAIIDPVGETSGAAEIGFDKADHPNASAILFDNLDRNPDALAVTGPAGTLTYRDLCSEAARWGNAFIAQGLERSERIAFFLDDTPAHVAAFFGAVRAGFVPVLLNTQTTPDLLQFFLADTDARVAVCEAGFADKFDAETTKGTKLERVVIANGEGALTDPHFVHAADFTAGHPDALDCADTGPDDMAFWMYSSGSTGRPKGIVHLQHDMAYTALSFSDHILKLRPDDICFSVPKLFFAYGFGNSVTFPFTVGAASLLLPGRPEGGRVLDALEEFRPTVLFALPTLYTALCGSKDVDKRDMSSLRLSISAAEVLSEDIFNAWKSLSGLNPIEGLGSTEMLHVYLSNTQGEQRLASAGKRVPGYEVVLRDGDGDLVGPGEEGVMWVRGHSSAPAYWNRPDKTAETMRGDWIYTGDRFVERDGYYYFQGRADDLIKISGQWVWPLEVERCLAEHPHVYECAVLAHQLADKRMALRAIVRLHDGHEPDEAQTNTLQDWVKGQLLPFKYPRFVDYVDELPKTGTGKIDRQALVKGA